MYTLTIKIRIKENILDCLIFTVIVKDLGNLELRDLNLLGKECMLW